MVSSESATPVLRHVRPRRCPHAKYRCAENSDTTPTAPSSLSNVEDRSKEHAEETVMVNSLPRGASAIHIYPYTPNTGRSGRCNDEGYDA